MTYDFLKDDLLIVCSNDLKVKLISYCVENKLLFNIKYMTIEEFIKNLSYSYDEKTIVSVMNKFNLSFEVAKTMLDNIKYLIDEEKSDNRVSLLKDIKMFVQDNNLLIQNKLFKKLISGKEICIIGYDYINLYYKKIMEINDIKYRVINLKKPLEKTHVINEFNSMEDEVHYIANKILDLISEGVSINKIFVTNISENYNYLVDKIFKMYGIPFNKKNDNSLYETVVGNYFINNLNNDIKICIDDLKNKFKNSTDLINKIIDVINKYYFIDNWLDYKEILVYEFKNIKLDSKKYDNAVNIIELKDNIVEDDEYVFLLGFNLNVIPKIKRNEDYFSDEIKFSYMEKTNEKNLIEKDIWKNILGSINNLYISYSLNYLNENFYPSPLIDEMNFSVEKKSREITKYSDIANKLLLSDYLDNYFNYDIYNPNLDDLLSTYSLEYNSFDNKFNGIKTFDKDIVLSYSSMNNYYKCAFRYYLANVLKIDIYNENFSQYIGNLFHFCLQHYYEGNDNIDELYVKFLSENNYEFSEKEKHFIKTLRDEIKFIISRINRHNELSSFKDFKLEEKFVINHGNDVFKGFIDKILYKDKNVVIIDYKTGSIDIDLSLVPHGLSMQLPVYLYLAKKNNMDAKIVGFYLQHILNSKFRYDKNKTYDEQKKDALKLQGYSLGNEELLAEFDESFASSEVIKGMKLGKNGFYHYTKVLSESSMNRLYELAEERIENAFKEIKNADFTINPKIVKGKNVGCEFCSFKDICFKTNKDNVYLEIDEYLSFLGGDNNA